MRQSFSNCHNLNISLKFTGKIAIPTVGGVQNPSATPTLMQTEPPTNTILSPQQQQTLQKVQIVSSRDDKIQVSGLKVSKFQEQIFLFSFEPKKQTKLFFDFCPKDLK